MTHCSVYLVDSLQKVLPHTEPCPMKETRLIAFGGETVSFQLACRVSHGAISNGDFITFSVTGPLAEKLRLRRVGLEPVFLPAYEGVDTNYITKTPCMLPDILYPMETPVLRCYADYWSAAWADIQVPEELAAGEYAIDIEASCAGEVCARLQLTLCVRPQALPAQTLYHTEWFHVDCLADYYRVEAFSAEHWRIVDHFMASAARVGINMLLTPVFTPALDTEIGGERTTVQLVDVTVENGGYRFGFEKLGQWIDLCHKNGISELEICHLFTQWGAAAAPKIMAEVDGHSQRIFGWDTPSTGGEYTVFLRAFLPQLKAYLQSRGMLEHSWFHVSDEPAEENMEQWNAARTSVADLLEGCRVMDALSSFKLYEKGYIRIPVVSEDHLEPFVKAQVPGLWTYYCCGQHTDVPNRFLAMPAARSRILGVLLYYYNLAGFLQWGFNFYNGEHSRTHIDPYVTADGYGTWPAGDPFLVYPAPDGTAYESLRAATLREALQDLRMLRLAEDRLGREKVTTLIESCWEGGALSMTHYPTDPTYFAALRKAVCRALDA